MSDKQPDPKKPAPANDDVRSERFISGPEQFEVITLGEAKDVPPPVKK